MKTAALTITALFAFAGSAFAGGPQTSFDLADGNSAAHIDLTGPAAGMNRWTVDQTNRLKLQGFWYRLDTSENENNIGTLNLVGSSSTDTNGFSDNRADTLSARYSGNQGAFFIDPVWQIRGGTSGSGRADIAETISITNNQRSSPLVISFFQYADFDLSGDDGKSLLPDVSARITGANSNTAQQIGTEVFLSETVVTPAPTRWTVSTFAVLLNALSDGSLTDLDNNSGPIGPGDLVWGFQWNFTIAAGDTVIISKDKSLVPTPGAMALLGLGGLAATRRRRA